MRDRIRKHIERKKVAILGFGREGRSTYRLIRKFFPEKELSILDKNPGLNFDEAKNDRNTCFELGPAYLKRVEAFDVLFKSPGVSVEEEGISLAHQEILTQTSIFIENYSQQIIGITGTKGKSTTSSLIHHIFRTAGRSSVLVGNIGVPCFDAIEKIEDDSTIIFELSAHQLEQVENSPHIAILLNVYPEHFDYFRNFDRYAEAKLKIAKFQTTRDYFIYNQNDLKILEKEIKSCRSKQINLSTEYSRKSLIYIENQNIFSDLMNGQSIDISERKLFGKHNLKNILAAATACLLYKISANKIKKGINTFLPLEHRLEFIGTYCGIRFVNDSISTIPESTIEALKTINNVDTLILGGFDRGIDYSVLAEYLKKNPVPNILFTGQAGSRIIKLLQVKPPKSIKAFYFESYDELPALVKKNTLPGKACLLSPAASSYDQFNNFIERGLAFKKMAEFLGKSCH